MTVLNVHFKNGDMESVKVEADPEEIKDMLWNENLTKLSLKTPNGYYMFNPKDIMSIQMDMVD